MTVIPQKAQEPVAVWRRWLFGSAVLDERSLELTLAGQPVALDPKLLQMLMHLLEHAGEVVTKEELLEEVWPGRVISDSTLTKTVHRLREALQDKSQSLIMTRHGHGYRLVAPVRVETVEKPAPKLGLAAGDHPPLRPQWNLLERVGSGGHGELWLAQHDKTREVRAYKFALDGASLSSLKREITLNRLLRDSLHEKASVFVRLLDWNLEQLPSFVELEYLPAGSLVQWTDRQGGCAQIPDEVRLELAAQIAEALGLAHSVGVLHKDLKPSNVLIDAPVAQAPPAGEVSPPKVVSNAVRIKLCDFGSGGLLDRARLADGGIAQLGFTSTIGLTATSGSTPMYLAPEVLSGQPYSVPADCYSFGVLLYQLIAGDLRKALAGGWERDITDELLREDIAVLVDGDPERRMRDATEVAHRLRNLGLRRAERARLRQNEQEAVRLREALERSRVRRQWSLALAGVFGVGLLIAVLLLVQVRQAREEAHAQSRRAESEAATASAVNEFLLEDLLSQASPLESGRVDLRVREVLDIAATTAGSRFAKQPERERAVHMTVGRAYSQLGDYSKAETELRAALSLTPDSDDQQRALIDLHLGEVISGLDRREEARAALSRAALHGDPEVRLLAAVQLAGLRSFYDDDHVAALSELLSLRPRLEAQFGAEHPRLDNLITELSAVYHNDGQYKKAVVLARELVGRLQERHGQGDPREILAQISLGAALSSAEEYGESLQVLEAVLPRAQATLGENHLQTFTAVRELAMAHSGLGQNDKALAILEPVFDTLRSRYGAEHFETLAALNALGAVYHERGEHSRQVALLEPYLAILQRKFGESAEETLMLMSNLAVGYAETGKTEKAEAMQAHAMSLARESIPNHWLTGAIALDHAQSLVSLGRFEEADAMFEEAIRRSIETLGEDHSQTVFARQKHDAMRERREVAAEDRRS
ncbi:MAG: tetratricopeptide repeat protein [Panacagrimonas sp.]